jgi:hypothetical protein
MSTTLPLEPDRRFVCSSRCRGVFHGSRGSRRRREVGSGQRDRVGLVSVTGWLRPEDFPSAKAWVAFGAVAGVLYGAMTGWILGQLPRRAPAPTLTAGWNHRPGNGHSPRRETPSPFRSGVRIRKRCPPLPLHVLVVGSVHHHLRDERTRPTMSRGSHAPGRVAIWRTPSDTFV